MAQIPEWHVEGDWFDVCKCSIPCPCTFAQTPSFGDCDGVLAYHVRRGRYGDVALDGLNVLAVGHFEGNIWAGETKVNLGMFIDERASEEQRDALRRIWGGEVGGFPAMFAQMFGEVRGLEFAPIEIEVADDLAYWRAEIPGKVSARAEALGGPMTPPGRGCRRTTRPARRRAPAPLQRGAPRSPIR